MKYWILALVLTFAPVFAADCNTCTPIGNSGLMGCTLLGCISDSSTAFRLRPDTSTWVINLEDGGKKLEVRYGSKIYRFRPRDGKINLDTIITEKP